MKIRLFFFVAVLLFSNLIDTKANTPENSALSVGKTKSGQKEVQSSVSFVTEAYAPGATMDLVFYYSYSTPDGEWDDGVSLDFPAGVFVNHATVCTVTGQHQLPYNGETGDGALVTWGNIEGGSGWGGLRSSGQFSVNVTISEDFTGLLSVVYFIAGDGYGAPPNFATGTIELQRALDQDLAILNVMPRFVMLGNDFAPVVSIKNTGVETINAYTVQVDVPEFAYSESVSINEPIDSGNEAHITFPAYAPQTEGPFVITAILTEGGGEETSNDTLIVNAMVGVLAEAYAINGQSNTYTEVNLSNGQMTSLGPVANYPWALAEEFDGKNIYRILYDGSIGIVDSEGSFTLLGTMTGVPGYTAGLAYNWDTEQMFVIVQNINTDYSHICTLDMNTLELTEIGINTELILGVDFANDGFLYGVSFQNNLLKIDPNTGDATTVGPIGIDITYPQDVSFDVKTGRLYTIASGTYFSVFGSYNLQTGAFELIADLSGVYYQTLVITNVPTQRFSLDFEITDVNGAEIADAIITLNGVSYQPGEYSFDLEPGTHNFNIEKEGYFSQSGEVELGHADHILSIALQHYFTLGFQISDVHGTEISDAIVSLNGVAYQPGEYSFDLLPDSYSYMVNKDGYFPLSGEVDLNLDHQTLALVLQIDNTTVENFVSEQLRVYPNPASGIITVHADTDIQSLRILSLDGREALHTLVHSKQTQINLENLPAGFYILQVVTHQQIINHRIQIL